MSDGILKSYFEMDASHQMAFRMGQQFEQDKRAGLTSQETIESTIRWIEESKLALNAATTIGKRHYSGDHLNYANHGRLVVEAELLLTRLRAVAGVEE